MSRDSRSRRGDQMYGAARLSPVSVRARAVVPIGDGILVARERRHGRDHVTLPGGRVDQGEGAATTALREVHEETGVEIELGPLLYVAEVVSSARRQDLNLIFLGRPLEPPPDGVDLVRPEDDDVGIMPPILDRIWRDRANGWEEMGVWLGNVWRGDLGR
ncbi:MAG TPA: NUDIX domain-containing protein [Solirubrobacterales bacterium]|nr:NUDIX domain-containing protein [Solirubrobacterales bacterium]